MHEIMIIIASLALGALAWEMLVISDWLLGDAPPNKSRPINSGRRKQLETNHSVRTQLEPRFRGLFT